MAEHEHGMMSIPYKEYGIPVYRACSSAERRPAVILIHEVWGLSDHIKDVADRFCREGYEVIAPDLMANTDMTKVIKPELQKVIFDPVKRLEHQVEIRAMMAPLGAPGFADETIAKLKTVFEYLENDQHVGKIFVVGFCFGGTYAFGLAVNKKGLAGAVPFYGHGEQYIDRF
ncbi:MAG TPA: dienelactone hydrolase family protein, partial [Candidatus Saccharimonadales bacterium]|nr:dienelactone hydrolase family protein [Candidatus Saccharimonadales bacterium]